MTTNHTHKPDKLNDGSGRHVHPSILYTDKAACRCDKCTPACDLNFALSVLDKAEAEELAYFQYDAPDTIEALGVSKTPCLREAVSLTPTGYDNTWLAVLIGEGEWKLYEQQPSRTLWKCLKTGSAPEVAEAFASYREFDRSKPDA